MNIIVNPQTISVVPKAVSVNVEYPDGTAGVVTPDQCSDADIQAYKDAITAIQALPIDAANMAAINDIAGKIVSSAAATV